MTDGADENLVSAVVTIDKIYLQGGDGADDGGSGAGRVVLRSDPVTTDLLSLSNDVATLVDEAVVRDGMYSQLRFVISGAYIEVRDLDGSTRLFATPGYDAVPHDRQVDGQLRTPSWASSGFKVKLPENGLKIEGEQKILVVDFDVAESLGKETGTDAWVMRPILKAFDFQLSGSIEIVATGSNGVSMMDMNHVNVALTDAEGNAEGTLPLSDPDNDGTFTAFFAYLNPKESPFAATLVDDSGNPVTIQASMPLTIAVDSGQIERRQVVVLDVAP